MGDDNFGNILCLKRMYLKSNNEFVLLKMKISNAPITCDL